MCDMNPISAIGAIAGAGAGMVAGIPGMIAGGIGGGFVGDKLGDALGFGGDGYQFQNPGTIDLQSTNPEMYKEIELARSQRDSQQGFQKDFLDPQRYQAMTDLYSQRAQTAATNQAANMGMAGSGLGMGMANQAAFNSDQAMINRQLQDHMQIAQMNAILNGQVTSDILNVQNQYANFQNNQAQADAASKAQNTQMLGSIMGVAGTIGGAMVAGPPGAIAGGAIGGSMMGSGGSSMPEFSGYQSSNYGYMSGTPSDYSSPSFGQSSPYYSSPSNYGGMGVNYGSIY